MPRAGSSEDVGQRCGPRALGLQLYLGRGDLHQVRLLVQLKGHSRVGAHKARNAAP